MRRPSRSAFASADGRREQPRDGSGTPSGQLTGSRTAIRARLISRRQRHLEIWCVSERNAPWPNAVRWQQRPNWVLDRVGHQAPRDDLRGGHSSTLGPRIAALPRASTVMTTGGATPARLNSQDQAAKFETSHDQLDHAEQTTDTVVTCQAIKTGVQHIEDPRARRKQRREAKPSYGTPTRSPHRFSIGPKSFEGTEPP